MWTNEQISISCNSHLEDVQRFLPLIIADLTALKITDQRAIAGALATIAVENHFKSINEYGSDAYFTANYDITANPKKAKELGNIYPGDGAKFHGRGLPQLTGRANYHKYSACCGVDLETYPERMLEPEIGSKVFAQYFKDHGMDVHSIRGNWRKVRRLFNGGLNGYPGFLEYVMNTLDLWQ